MNLSLSTSSFFVGPLEVKLYAICIMLAFIFCGLIALKLFEKRGFNKDLVLDCLIAIIPCAVVGARVWYVLFELDEFKTASGGIDFKSILKIWEGGLAIHGGVMLSVLGLFIVSKIRGIKLGKLTDICATCLPLGQAIGRWGNFFNQEVYGLPTTSKFAVKVFIESTGQYHHALFFYEMLLNLILFAFLYYFINRYKGKRDLYSTSFYLIGYGVIRSVLEPLRDKEFQMGYGVPSSLITALCLLAIGLVILGVSAYKDVKDNNLWWKGFFKKSTTPPSSEYGETSEEIENNENKGD